MGGLTMSASPWWTTITDAEVADLRDRLTRWIASRFGQALKSEIDDVAQHALLMLHLHRSRVLPQDDGLFRYLLVVARNRAVDVLRSRTFRTKILSAVPQTPEDATCWPAESSDEIAQVRKFFCELDARDRLYLWKHVVLGRAIQAIAKEQGVSWQTVADTVARALLLLNVRLQPRSSGEDCPVVKLTEPEQSPFRSEAV